MGIRIDQIEERKLYSAGDCPICADSGALFCLKELEAGRLIIFCPQCGVAWHEPPGYHFDATLSLQDLAPKGVTLPTSSEAQNSRFTLEEVPFDEWFEFLNAELDRERD